MKSIKQFIPILILICLSLIAWYLQLYHYLSFDTLKVYQHTIQRYIILHPIGSVLTYMFVYITMVGLSIPGATILSIIGGIFFGQYLGTFAVVVSATAGASVIFITAKFASQDLIEKRVGGWLQWMKDEFQKDAFYYLLTLRLIPIFPFVAINLVAAAFQIPLRTFLMATFIGIIPGSFIYVSIGDALKEIVLMSTITPKIIFEPKVFLSLTGLGILSLLPAVYNRLRHR